MRFYGITRFELTFERIIFWIAEWEIRIDEEVATLDWNLGCKKDDKGDLYQVGGLLKVPIVH
jgi:hypothetical protein